jgi:hypothetical protein
MSTGELIAYAAAGVIGFLIAAIDMKKKRITRLRSVLLESYEYTGNLREELIKELKWDSRAEVSRLINEYLGTLETTPKWVEVQMPEQEMASQELIDFLRWWDGKSEWWRDGK